MTVEELRAEAKKLGYDIIKARRYVPHLKCHCGLHAKVKYGVHKDDECSTRPKVMIFCDECNLSTEWAKTDRMAWKMWYEMITGNKFDD